MSEETNKNHRDKSPVTNPWYRMPALVRAAHRWSRANSLDICTQVTEMCVDPPPPTAKITPPLGHIRVSRSHGQLRMDWNVSDEAGAEVQFRRRMPTTNWTLVSLFYRSKVTIAPSVTLSWQHHPQSCPFFSVAYSSVGAQPSLDVFVLSASCFFDKLWAAILCWVPVVQALGFCTLSL